MPLDWSNPIAAGISGLFDIAGSAIQYKYQKKLAEQQNQFNLDMWKMQNEYNSPAAQMKRFQEAGLNPNLIYGQGNAGNASSAPEMVTPNAPELSRGMRELAQAFNIEGLRTAIANRKKAEADAKNASADAERNTLQLGAEKRFGVRYMFDPHTGMYVERPVNTEGIEVISPYSYYMNDILANNFRTNSLLYRRASLIGSQQSLNQERKKLYAPQIQMLNYQAKYQPWTFWLGNVKTGVQALSNFLPLPTKFARPAMRYVSKYYH